MSTITSSNSQDTDDDVVPSLTVSSSSSISDAKKEDTSPTQDKKKQDKRAADEVAEKLGVVPTATLEKPNQRKRASFWFRQWLTLSQILDPIRIPNSHVNYQCVWWKAISGNDANSPVRDGGLAYDMLPPLTRWAVASPLASKYPRFHHANVELRTKYLDNAMDQIIQKVRSAEEQKKCIRIVLMGGGYDLRLIRVAEHYESLLKEENDHGDNEQQQQQQQQNQFDLVELDLPRVIAAKSELLEKRFLRRRPELTDLVNRIRMIGVDLNKITQVETVVRAMLEGKDLDMEGNEIVPVADGVNAGDKANPMTTGSSECFTIFIFEAVLIYLDDQVPSRLLSILSQALKSRGESGAICFADTLLNVDCNRQDAAKLELEEHGWELQDWLPKPGRTRHMGWASLASG